MIPAQHHRMRALPRLKGALTSAIRLLKRISVGAKAASGDRAAQKSCRRTAAFPSRHPALQSVSVMITCEPALLVGRACVPCTLSRMSCAVGSLAGGRLGRGPAVTAVRTSMVIAGAPCKGFDPCRQVWDAVGTGNGTCTPSPVTTLWDWKRRVRGWGTRCKLLRASQPGSNRTELALAWRTVTTGLVVVRHLEQNRGNFCRGIATQRAGFPSAPDRQRPRSGKRVKRAR